MDNDTPMIDDRNSNTAKPPVVDYASAKAKTRKPDKPIRLPGPMFGVLILMLFGAVFVIAVVLVLMLFA